MHPNRHNKSYAAKKELQIKWNDYLCPKSTELCLIRTYGVKEGTQLMWDLQGISRRAYWQGRASVLTDHFPAVEEAKREMSRSWFLLPIPI